MLTPTGAEKGPTMSKPKSVMTDQQLETAMDRAGFEIRLGHPQQLVTVVIELVARVMDLERKVATLENQLPRQRPFVHAELD